jgi:hypothetical protein
MIDILKFRELIEQGYKIYSVKKDADGKCEIGFIFSGRGIPSEGQLFFLMTEDEAVIMKAYEIYNR